MLLWLRMCMKSQETTALNYTCMLDNLDLTSEFLPWEILLLLSRHAENRENRSSEVSN